MLCAIFIWLTFGSFILALILGLICKITNRGGFATAALACIIVMIISLFGVIFTEPSAIEKEYQRALDNNYTVYVNGVEVDPDNIYVNQYKVHIDDEQHKVMLANKR